MNVFLFVAISLCIVSIQANFTIVEKIPSTNILWTTRQLSCRIDRPVNPPAFSSFINIFNASTNVSIQKIDTTSVIYSNNTITFNITGFNVSDEFYITFDVGVLFSNSSENSTAQTDRQFWYLRVIDIQTSTSLMSTLEHTLTGMTQHTNTDTSMTSHDTSAFTVTIGTMTYPTTSQTMGTITPTGKMNTGESSPTRSAQIGMGLGITFITILIIIEVIYFKYCYSGNGRSGNYYT